MLKHCGDWSQIKKTSVLNLSESSMITKFWWQKLGSTVLLHKFAQNTDVGCCFEATLITVEAAAGMHIHTTHFKATIHWKKKNTVFWVCWCQYHPPISVLLFVPSAQLFPSRPSWIVIPLHLNTLKSKKLIAAAGQTQTVHHLEVNPSQTKLADSPQPGGRVTYGSASQTFSGRQSSPMSSSAHSSTPPLCSKFVHLN